MTLESNILVRNTQTSYYMHPKYYSLSVEWTGVLYCEVILYWDYKQIHVTMSMTGYVEEEIYEYQQKFQHTPSMQHTNGNN